MQSAGHGSDPSDAVWLACHGPVHSFYLRRFYIRNELARAWQLAVTPTTGHGMPA